MLPYDTKLKKVSQNLQREMTDAERRLWSRIRAKQISGIQFYRQKPIGNYIVDFYAPAAKLVVEVDGAQHFEAKNAEKDKLRTEFLERLGLKVLRFDNNQVFTQTEDVAAEIYRVTASEIPPPPLFQWGEHK